jgi:hypothetical protein
MADATFLDQLATTLLSGSHQLADTVVVLPNRRAKVFLLEALRKKTPGNIFSPEIISIEEFVQNVSGIRAIDNIELLFEFYGVYQEITDKEKQQTFELFANWAKMLLQDFNEIDRYLLNSAHILSYLKDIEDIKHWSLDPDKKTTLIENYLQFWSLLPEYYERLYSHLTAKGVGYQGLIYREAIANLEHFSASCQPNQFIFAGFNALNAAEEKIIQHLLSLDCAKIYWDIDSVFLRDSHHDAGLFLRRFKESWPHYKTNPFEWISGEFSQPKNIQVIGTPKSIGQAKIAGNIIRETIAAIDSEKLNRVAIVLGEESLLVPLLYSLPSETGPLNITMGYSGKNNPAQILIAKLFKMHVNALNRNAKSYVLYYKDVLDILTHPLVEPYANANNLVRLINLNNYTFITHQRLMELNENHNPFFLQLFKKWENTPLTVLENLSALLLTIKSNLSNDNREEKIAKAFVYAIFKVINKLVTYFSGHEYISNLETLQAVYKQVIDLAEVSFEGEPLDGLQIMGVLESRVLDFDTVIVTSMNEGKFPAGKSQNSFIPYDVKREMGLPTFKEKDAIYTYHFYHLLQRAKNIYLLYNTESEGLDGGEKSRFITQLEIEKQPAHNLTHEIYNAVVPETAYHPVIIPKSESVMLRLRELAEKGFSPSSLTTYIRNPLQFYFQRILRISEADEVEENIALNTLGTIIHHTLEELYKPFIGAFLTVEGIKNCISKIDTEVLAQFRTVYKEGEIKKGRNLLAFEVAKRHVWNFLKMELAELENDVAIKILALEQTYERTIEHPLLPFPVKIKGNVDRIEQRGNRIRIIDYKTGKVDKNNVQLSAWEGMTQDIKNDKIIQVLAYAFMFEPEAAGREMEVGIVSFKNMKSGFLPFIYIEDKVEISVVNQAISENYIDQLVVLLNEILDPAIPFEEKVV